MPHKRHQVKFPGIETAYGALMSQEDAAEILGITRSRVCQIENNALGKIYRAFAELLDRNAAICEVTREQFLEEAFR